MTAIGKDVVVARAKRVKVIAVTAVVGLASIGMVAAGAGAAHSATTTINPFAANDGFTIFAQGDVSLGNAELEGSIAVNGTLAVTKNNYPVIHRAAGMADYTVPVIDGEPVRILAQDLDLTAGSIGLTNREAPADSPEARAIAKLVDTSALSFGVRADFVRASIPGAADHGYIDLEAIPSTEVDTAEARVQTAQATVADYFSGVDAHVDAVASCLAYTYSEDAADDVAYHRDFDQNNGPDLVAGKANVLDYDEIASKGGTVKLTAALANGFVPSADSPIVIRVAPGTTSVGTVNFEGWDAGASGQQSYARYIMFDLSDVTGDVAFGGPALGAVYAPNADVTFDSGITHNGQWFTSGFTAAAGAGGELHHHTFLASIPCANVDDEAAADEAAADEAAADEAAADEAAADEAAADEAAADEAAADEAAADEAAADEAAADEAAADEAAADEAAADEAAADEAAADEAAADEGAADEAAADEAAADEAAADEAAADEAAADEAAADEAAADEAAADEAAADEAAADEAAAGEAAADEAAADEAAADEAVADEAAADEAAADDAAADEAAADEAAADEAAADEAAADEGVGGQAAADEAAADEAAADEAAADEAAADEAAADEAAADEGVGGQAAAGEAAADEDQLADSGRNDASIAPLLIGGLGIIVIGAVLLVIRRRHQDA